MEDGDHRYPSNKGRRFPRTFSLQQPLNAGVQIWGTNDAGRDGWNHDMPRHYSIDKTDPYHYDRLLGEQ
jgi:hypothetical protein